MTRLIFRLLLPCLLPALLASCHTAKKPLPPPSPGVLAKQTMLWAVGKHWILSSCRVGGVETGGPSSVAGMTFTVDLQCAVSITAPVNSYVGSLKLLPDGNIEWAREWGGTSIRGEDSLAAMEKQWMDALRATNHIGTIDGRLLLTSPDGQVRMEFHQPSL